MATLGDFLNVTQITTLKANVINASKARKNAAKSAVKTDYIPENIWDMLFDITHELGQKLYPKFWNQVNNLFRDKTESVICLKGCNECEIMTVTHNVIWAKHLGEMLKRGYRMLYVRKNGRATEITWDNWKIMYRTFTTQPEINDYEEKPTNREIDSIRDARRKEREFYDLARPIRSKKGGKIRISFEEARNQRMRAERISLESQIEYQANKIFETL